MKSEDGKITIALKEYFADFRMDEEEEKPVSASDEPNNPAIRYEVSWGEEAAPKKAVGFAFADYPDLAMIHVEGAQEKAVETVYDFDRSMMDVGIFAENSVVFLIAGPGDKLHYAARRPGEERHSGPVELENSAFGRLEDESGPERGPISAECGGAAGGDADSAGRGLRLFAACFGIAAHWRRPLDQRCYPMEPPL
jgi:hypothetical protein